MMTMDAQTYWEHMGVAGALGISVFVLLGLALRLAEAPAPRLHLWAMVAFFVINCSDGVHSIAYSDLFEVPGALYMWHYVLIPGFMVSLYFYVRALTSARPALRPRDAVHLLPFVLGALCLSPALILPGDVRLGRVDGELSDKHLRLLELGEPLFWSLWVLVLAIYGTLCARRLIRHKRNVRAVFSDLQGRTLRWLDGLVVTILALASLVIVDEIRLLMGMWSLRDGLGGALFDVVLPLSFGVFALRAQPVLPEWSAQVLTTPEEAPTPDSTPPERYARSGLQADDLDRFAARLERRMTEGQLWRDHGLNLRGLASEIAVPPIHLSEVLNTRLGMSFYDYVNQCRIRDACDLLAQTEDTIIEISETVGFNAKSTFNTSFKKITGQTPSQWRASQRA